MAAICCCYGPTCMSCGAAMRRPTSRARSRGSRRGIEPYGLLSERNQRQWPAATVDRSRKDTWCGPQGVRLLPGMSHGSFAGEGCSLGPDKIRAVSKLPYLRCPKRDAHDEEFTGHNT